MKKIVLIPILLVSLNVSSQVKVIHKVKTEIVSLPYDSIQNCLDKTQLEQYIGQTFYLPKTENEKERGFYDFKKDIKGKVYHPIGGAYSRKTKYEAVAGKYFEVIGVERKTRAYIDDVYIHLKNKETNEELYFDYGKLGFPFIVQGYYEKTRSNMIGRLFYLDFGRNPKKCIDYYIEEGATYSEVLKFDDFEGSPGDFDFKPLAEIRGRIHAASKNSAEYQNVPRECSAPPACSLSGAIGRLPRLLFTLRQDSLATATRYCRTSGRACQHTPEVPV